MSLRALARVASYGNAHVYASKCLYMYLTNFARAILMKMYSLLIILLILPCDITAFAKSAEQEEMDCNSWLRITIVPKSKMTPLYLMEFTAL